MNIKRLTYYVFINILLYSCFITYPADAKKPRNPFQYGPEASIPINNIPYIEMILINGREKCVIIGGKKHFVGDTAFNARIKSIYLDYIVLESLKGEKKVRLNETF